MSRPADDARLRVLDEVHERLVHDQRAAGPRECRDASCVQHARGVARVRDEDELGVVGDGWSAKPSSRAAVHAAPASCPCARSAARPPRTRASTIAVVVCGGEAAASSQNPSAAPLSTSTLLGLDAVRWRDRGPRRVSSGYGADALPRLLHRVGQPRGRRRRDDVDGEVLVPGADQLVAVERRAAVVAQRRGQLERAAGDDEQDAVGGCATAPGWRRRSGRASGGSAGSAGTGPRPASSATTISGAVRGAVSASMPARTIGSTCGAGPSKAPWRCITPAIQAPRPSSRTGPGRERRARPRPRSSSTRGRGGPGGRRSARPSRRRSPRRSRGRCRRRPQPLRERALAAAAAAEDEGQAHASK